MILSNKTLRNFVCTPYQYRPYYLHPGISKKECYISSEDKDETTKMNQDVCIHDLIILGGIVILAME